MEQLSAVLREELVELLTVWVFWGFWLRCQIGGRWKWEVAAARGQNLAAGREQRPARQRDNLVCLLF